MLLWILGPSATKRPRRFPEERRGLVSDCRSVKGFNPPFNTLTAGGAAVGRDPSLSQVTCVRPSVSSKLLLETVTDEFLIVRSCAIEEQSPARSLSLRSGLRLWGRRALSDIRGVQRERRRTCHSPSRGGDERGEVTHIQMPPGAVHYLTLAPSASNAL